MSSYNRPPCRILALDGIGLRCLSSLIILKELISRINDETPLKPCEYFNLIGGTGAGGFIAILLGRLGMSVDECIDVCSTLCRMVFDEPRYPNDRESQAYLPQSDKRLKHVVETVLLERGISRNRLLKDNVFSFLFSLLFFLLLRNNAFTYKVGLLISVFRDI